VGRQQRPLVIAGVSAVIAIAIGIVISYAIHWFPAVASTQAKETDTLYHVLVIASIPIFVIVVSVILYSVWQFHMKPGEELKDGPPIHGNTRLEVFWTAIPTVLLLGMVGYSFVVLHNNEKKPAREIQIGVTAQQFAWSYQYPPSVTGGAPLSSDQLYVPKGESVDSRSTPRTSSTPSGCPRSGCRRTSCRASPRTGAPPRSSAAATRSSATCCAASGTR
jgi:cytochrome c oxidase subunit 2